MYKIVHSLSGYTFGCWSCKESAENYRDSLDDWWDWSVEKFYI